ncbi:serine protein kinase RIO [Promethearchaeum syntrophicum]|uniref:non-specific serine/threonine protein kinase n=1 Tax=Promethearchaeum syntrophicum TaxID=2594042 RepID=A0A5B9D763_9ARCH|nr:serine protein kinase RIO [Candidatus Prometheoarchaeum syntrophicum]QEE14833.1 RIO-type serine/threonine-protein kinase Rio1 [Candidatus Prometheoarchaeum syntrophicum]
MEDDNKINRLEVKQDKRRMKSKRKTEEHAAFNGVFDSFTLVNLNKILSKGIINEFVGIISAGKEANVYYALGEEDVPLAVKIYKIDPQNTKWMKNYIIGDPRFKKIGTSTHKIIYTWCKKEFKNLTQMKRHDILVPTPLLSRDNILVMEFIGEENGTPAKRLKDIDELVNPIEEMNYILDQISKMYLNAHLVHGDLSEFNILYFKGKQIIIDVSQAVSIYHINAPVYLQRDIKNVLNYFSKFIDSKHVPDVKAVFEKILKNV